MQRGFGPPHPNREQYSVFPRGNRLRPAFIEDHNRGELEKRSNRANGGGAASLRRFERSNEFADASEHVETPEIPK